MKDLNKNNLVLKYRTQKNTAVPNKFMEFVLLLGYGLTLFGLFGLIFSIILL